MRKSEVLSETDEAMVLTVDGKVRSELFADTFMYHPDNYAYLNLSSKNR